MSGRPPKKFREGYTYSDIARVLDMTEAAVRQAVSRGKFDPTSVESITEYIGMRSQMDRKRQVNDLISRLKRLTGDD